MSVLNLISKTLVAASIAFLATTAAAAPPPPVFAADGVTFTKVGDGSIRAPGGRSFVVDGVNIYAAVGSHVSSTGAVISQIFSSNDGGKTWGAGWQLGNDFGDVFGVRVALSADPAGGPSKLLHASWISYTYTDNQAAFLNYTYSHAGQNDWSAVTQTPLGTYVDSGWSSLVVGPDAVAHVLYDDGASLYFIENAGPGTAFGASVTLGSFASSGGSGAPAMAVDNANNLYIVCSNIPDVMLFKRAAGANRWKISTIASDNKNGEQSYPTLVVTDADTYYAAYTQVTIDANGNYFSHPVFAFTRNGGKSWVRRVVGTEEGQRPTLVVNGRGSQPTLTMAVEQPGEELPVGIYRSNDLFKTYSFEHAAVGVSRPSLALDTYGKVLIMVFDPQLGLVNVQNTVVSFSRER